MYPNQEQYGYFPHSEIERKTGIRGTQISTSITTNIHSEIYKNKFGFQERFGATRRGSILVLFELYGTSILYRTLAHQKVLKHAARSKGICKDVSFASSQYSRVTSCNSHKALTTGMQTLSYCDVRGAVCVCVCGCVEPGPEVLGVSRVCVRVWMLVRACARDQVCASG